MDRFNRFFETLIPVPVVYQSHNYDCGAAALRAVCQFWGVGPDEEAAFIRACDTDPELGTRPEDIIRVARTFGLKAAGREHLTVADLKALIDAGRPVICLIQAWERDGEEYGEDDYDDNDSGHYVVAIGYDAENVVFQDPSIKNNRRGHIPYAEFERRWHDIDRRKKVLRRFGIVLWRADRPAATDADMRSSKIK